MRCCEMARTRAIEIIGEAANKVSAEGQAEHSEILWRAIVGTVPLFPAFQQGKKNEVC